MIRDALARIRNGRVLVVGDVMLDRNWSGPSNRLSPEAPVPVVKIEEIKNRPGGAANVALNISALGGKVDLLGVIGDDEAGRTLRDLLTAQSVNCHLLPDSKRQTTIKLRVLSKHQQLIRLDFESDSVQSESDSFFKTYETLLRTNDAVILSDYGKGTLTDFPRMIALARSCGVPVLIDPKGSDFNKYRGATVITPNRSEFQAVAGQCKTEDELTQSAFAMRERLELDALLITRSEEGMSLYRAPHEVLHLPTHAQEVFDVTGAGDTVVATMGAAIASGVSMDEAVALSNIAAGIVVAKLGAATARPEEILQAVQQRREPHSAQSMVDQQELKTLLSDLQKSGRRVVMTNGCFDILHPGHVDYLEKAKALGDCLVVAVNDDESVRRLKGESRPINTLSTRMRMLAALSSVDWVVPFSEDTPERLYCELKPDVLVKGGDYTEEQIAGADCVKAAGGRVEIVRFVDGFSSSNVIQKIKQS